MCIEAETNRIWNYYAPTVALIRQSLQAYNVPYRSHSIVIARTDRLQNGPPTAYVEIQLTADDTIRVFPADVTDPPQISKELVDWIIEWERHHTDGHIVESG